MTTPRRKCIPICVGGVHFTAKTKCQHYIQSVLNYHVGKIEEDSKDFNILLDLLSFHTEAKEKIGCGISYFTTEDSPYHKGQKFFVLHRKDGTKEDFSFIKCLGWADTRTTSLQHDNTQTTTLWDPSDSSREKS